MHTCTYDRAINTRDKNTPIGLFSQGKRRIEVKRLSDIRDLIYGWEAIIFLQSCCLTIPQLCLTVINIEDHSRKSCSHYNNLAYISWFLESRISQFYFPRWWKSNLHQDRETRSDSFGSPCRERREERWSNQEWH